MATKMWWGVTEHRIPHRAHRAHHTEIRAWCLTE